MRTRLTLFVLGATAVLALGLFLCHFVNAEQPPITSSTPSAAPAGSDASAESAPSAVTSEPGRDESDLTSKGMPHGGGGHPVARPQPAPQARPVAKPQPAPQPRPIARPQPTPQPRPVAETEPETETEPTYVETETEPEPLVKCCVQGKCRSLTESECESAGGEAVNDCRDCKPTN